MLAPLNPSWWPNVYQYQNICSCFLALFSALQWSAFLLLSHWQSSCQKVTWSSWQFSPGPVYHFRAEPIPGFCPLIICASNRSPLREFALGFLAEVCSDIYQEILKTDKEKKKKKDFFIGICLKKKKESVSAFLNFHTQSFQFHGNLSPFHAGDVSNWEPREKEGLLSEQRLAILLYT